MRSTALVRELSLSAAFTLLLLSGAAPVLGEEEALLWINPKAPGEVLAYWTPERRAAVEPMEFPPLRRSIAAPLQSQPEAEVGSSKAHFTSSRLVPLDADLIYPYRAAGRLEFRTLEGTAAHCSGALIKPRVVLTAGHCVHKGSSGNSGFFSDFIFMPGYRDGISPFGTWEAAGVVVTTTWSTGNAKLPNAADYAVVILEDNPRRAGDVVGWFGFALQKLIPNHVTMLGYPANLDGGKKIHQVTAASFKAGTKKENVVLYGSDMTQGSSGGPWVQNFGAKAVGQGSGTNPGANLIVGVTSFVDKASATKFAGSSILDTRLTALLSVACALTPGNC